MQLRLFIERANLNSLVTTEIKTDNDEFQKMEVFRRFINESRNISQTMSLKILRNL